MIRFLFLITILFHPFASATIIGTVECKAVGDSWFSFSVNAIPALNFVDVSYGRKLQNGNYEATVDVVGIEPFILLDALKENPDLSLAQSKIQEIEQNILGKTDPSDLRKKLQSVYLYWFSLGDKLHGTGLRPDIIYYSGLNLITFSYQRDFDIAFAKSNFADVYSKNKSAIFYVSSRKQRRRIWEKVSSWGFTRPVGATVPKAESYVQYAAYRGKIFPISLKVDYSLNKDFQPNSKKTNCDHVFSQ